MAGEGLWLYVIGARDGSVPLLELTHPALARDAGYVLFEPGSDAIDEIREVSAERPSPSVILPYALGKTTGTATLNVTYDPFASSLRTPLRTPIVTHASGYDYPCDEVYEVVERVDVPVFRIDELPELGQGRIGPPDVLHVDTQGSELDVFDGAGALLDGVLAIVCELSYHQFYDGEAIFGDVVNALARRGLQFAAAVHGLGGQPYRMPLGLRGEDWLLQSDVLFLRRIETVEHDRVALCKLAFVAHLIRQTTYGFEAMRRYVERYGDDFGAGARGAFLRELYVALGEMTVIRTASFNELYSVEESFARFDPARRDAAHAAVTARALGMAKALLQQEPSVAQMLAAGDTPVEAVYRRWQLTATADVVRGHRLNDMYQYLSALGATVKKA